MFIIINCHLQTFWYYRKTKQSLSTLICFTIRTKEKTSPYRDCLQTGEAQNLPGPYFPKTIKPRQVLINESSVRLENFNTV